MLLLLSLWLGLDVSAPAQTAVPVGAGSYATGIPAADQFVGGFYSMTPQQVVTNYANLHLASTLTNRPIPSNKWWTDLLVGDRSYQPAANTPRTLVQDPFGGQLWAYPAVLAPNAGGFNLYFPNAWTPSGSDPSVPQGSFLTGPALPITGAIPAAVGTNDILLADFDGSAYPLGWVTTGTAFGTGPIAGGTWPGELPAVQGFIGGACVNTYRGADSPQGTLTSPAFTIQKQYIHLLVGGGKDTNNAAVWLMVGTNVVRSATGQQNGTLYWNTWDVSAYVGQTAQIKLVDTTSGSWGFVLCSWIVASDDGSNPAARYTSTFSPLHSEVTDWSDWGVRFGLPDGQGRRMDITLARGVPFVWTTYTGLKPQIGFGGATLYDTNGTTISTSGGSFSNSAFAFDYQGRSFGVFAPDRTTFLLTNGVLEAELSGTNNYLVYGLLPAHTNLAEFTQYAYAEVTNTTYSWVYDVTNGRVATTWTLSTLPLKGTQTNTLQGWLPHHYRTTAYNLSFKPYSFLTPRGLMQVAAGNQFQIAYNFRGIAPVLPAPRTNNLPHDYVAGRMTNYLLSFAAGNPYNVGDSYGAGKELGLSAQYMSFARQLGMTNQAAQLAGGLRNILSDWFTYTPGETGNFFARYDNWRALVGFPPGYGSEAFNDNHFHYGYFLDATALLGMEDSSFLSQYGPMARLLAKQYANWDRSDTNFPFLRTFDIWEGHSWAGGFSSGSGNNQESSSEAMNSWVGLFLLGNQMGDSAMASAGAMGYAVESTAVNEYWQDMHRTNLPASYGKGGVGVVWSGGLSYGTYFSGDPAWIYGIQWVPANHWNNYLARDPVFANWQLTNMWTERVIASQHNLSGFTLTDSNNAVAQGAYLGNYILGFQMLFDTDGVAALMDAAYATNAAIAIDATYSGVTYYLTHALRGLGTPDTDYYTSIPTSQVYYNAATGRRTYVIYNAAPTNQVAVVYHLGTPVDSVNAPAGKLVTNFTTSTNATVLQLQSGAQVSWPTVNGDAYQVQWTPGPTNSPAWNNLGEQTTGSGGTNVLFDAGFAFHPRNYRVLETTVGTAASVLANGGLESGSGTTADRWSQVGSQPPVRVNTDAHGGTYSMRLYVTNTASSPNNSEMDQNISSAGGTAIVPGTAYNFGFWAKSAGSGPSYVQNYGLTWLNGSGASLGFIGWNAFTAGNGAWQQIMLSNLVAPAGAVNARIQIYGVTGAVQNGYGGSLIDDVALWPAVSASTTNTVWPTVLPGVQLSWPTEAGANYQPQKALTLQPPGGWMTSVTLPGNGTPQTWFDAYSTNAQSFYRVLKLQ